MATLVGSEVVARLAVAGRKAPPRQQRLQWTLSADRPSDWRESVLRLGGGYFHTPAGVQSIAPTGDLVFAQLLMDGDLIGMGAGVRVGCGLSLAPRHVYFPTTPVVAVPSKRETALAALRDAFRETGSVELELDTWDARFEPAIGDDAEVISTRMEYMVPLARELELMRRRLSSEHLRLLRRLDEAGCRLMVTGAADSSNQALMLSARDGGGCGFTAAAWQDDALLAQARVGVAGARAYCRNSKLAPAGRGTGAMVWLQWQLMCQLAERDVKLYNLGAPAIVPGPNETDDPLRERLGFSPEMIRCRRVRWTLSSGHMRAHRVMGWFGRQSA